MISTANECELTLMKWKIDYSRYQQHQLNCLQVNEYYACVLLKSADNTYITKTKKKLLNSLGNFIKDASLLPNKRLKISSQ